MSGEAELDKPFSVDCLRHLLKDFDAAGVVLDEVVVGTEDCGDFALGPASEEQESPSFGSVGPNLAAQIHVNFGKSDLKKVNNPFRLG